MKLGYWGRAALVVVLLTALWLIEMIVNGKI